MSGDEARAFVNRMIDQQAYTLAANDVFLAGAATFVLLAALIWLARPARGGRADAGGAH